MSWLRTAAAASAGHADVSSPETSDSAQLDGVLSAPIVRIAEMTIWAARLLGADDGRMPEPFGQVAPPIR